MNKVTMLLDNITNNRMLKNGHGLSMHIEFNGLKLLMDTGPNKKSVENAKKLEISLTDLDGIVISHGHSDHTGGLKLPELSEQKIYCSHDIHNPKYLKILNFHKYVGMPKSLDKSNWTFISATKEIYPNVFLVPLRKKTKTTANLYKSVDETIILDDFSDEMILVLQHNQELTIFTGCSHHGIVEIIQEIEKSFPTKKIKHVVGGFHMIGIPYLNNLGMDKIEVQQIGKKLNNLSVDHFYTCHCTGMKAFKLLKPILKDKLSYLATGESLLID
ncbi:7,8-dihydropterin-6-yl-methyl-4-(beta-D-ribofuranosyl)aminobenzene 5'-phosphate synthase [Enterococcus sp. AZ194]|uniref:MBL fold metallo-hydrolase n=1 Tax=Enterococcus sp. AZ194 TaxID=2774629 RepID=UPI003F1E650C